MSNDPKKLNKLLRKAEGEIDPSKAMHNELMTQTDHLESIKDNLGKESSAKVTLELPEGVKIATLKGEKGEDGKTPTKQEIVALIEPLIPEPIQGEKGEDGLTPTEDELVSIITPLIPEPVKGEKGDVGERGSDGKTPVKGVDYFDGQNGKAATPDEIIEALRTSKKIDISDLRNSQQIISAIGKTKNLEADGFRFNGQKYKFSELMHGGGSGASTISLTTIGTSGVATLTGSVLNIPNYTYTLPTASTLVLGGVKVDGTTITISGGVISAVGGGTGTVTSVGSADGSITITNPTTTPDLMVVKATAGFTVTGGNVGIGTTSPGTILDIVGTSIRQSNTITDATNKAFRFQTRNFTNAQNDFLLVFGQSKTSANTLILGGGQTGSVAATTISFFTGAGNNTDTGTARMTIDATGNVLVSNLTASKVVFTDSLKQLTSTGIGTSAQFIKADGSLDSSTYLTGNQTITLSGDVTGSGATAIATTIKTNVSLAGSPTTTTQTFGDSSTKIATTAFVQSAITGTTILAAANVSTTANLVGVYLNGASGVGATFTYTATGVDTIDGVALTLGMRVLVKNQSSSFQNGIYSVTTAGAIGVAGILTRSTDYDQSAEVDIGDTLFVISGTTQGSTTWVQNGTENPVMGTDPITFVQTAGPGSYSAGNGLTLTGTSFSIDTSITVDKNTAQVLTNKSISGGQITSAVATATALATPRTIGTITGDATSAGSSFDGSANNTNALTLATVNSNVGTFGSATQVAQVTVNAKGLTTAVSNVTITPAASSITGGAALTKTDDTNVTLALGGSPTTALLAATSLTLGWTGTLSLARGGTGQALSDPNANSVMVWDDTTNAVRFAALSGLTYNSGTNTLTASASGITGADTQVLFFDGVNNPAGDAGFTYNKTTDSFTLAGKAIVGPTASISDYTNTYGIFSQADTGDTDTRNIGVLGEAVASGAGRPAAAIYGSVKTNGSDAGIGVRAFAQVTASADTGTATGGSFSASNTHSGGQNIGVSGVASGSGVQNTGMSGQGTTSGTILGIGVLGTGTVAASADTGVAYGGFFRATTTHSGESNVAIYAQATGSATNNIALWADDGYVRIDANMSVGTSVTPTALITLGAGTASANTAPLKFTAGTNLTTAEAGAFEKDANVFYSTPIASARGLSPSTMFSVIDSDFTLAAASGVQAAFPAAYDTWTLAASTSYRFEGEYYMTLGTTTRTTGLAFALGGGASVTSITYWCLSWAGQVNATLTTQASLWINTVSSTIINATTANTGTFIKFQGIIRMNAGGTVTPQIDFSANPGGTNLMKANSWISFTPIGTNAVTSVGNVA